MWIEDDNRVSSAAFKDSNGVSVDRDGGRSEKECINRLVNALPQITSVGRLSISEVDSCDAVTVYSPVDGNEYHCEIHDSIEQVAIKSKSKAKKLANKCQVVFRKDLHEIP